jgi:hypothetical protein
MKMNLHQLCQAHGIASPEPAGGPRCYRIIRYYKDTNARRTIRKNVTLTEAQGHCHRPETKTPDWFEGYDFMPGCAPKD